MCNVLFGLRKEKFGFSRWGWNRGWQDSFEITQHKHGVIPLSAYLPVPDSDPSLPLWTSLAWHSGRSKSLSNVSAQAAWTPGTPMLICWAPRKHLHHHTEALQQVNRLLISRHLNFSLCQTTNTMSKAHIIMKGLLPNRKGPSQKYKKFWFWCLGLVSFLWLWTTFTACVPASSEYISAAVLCTCSHLSSRV